MLAVGTGLYAVLIITEMPYTGSSCPPAIPGAHPAFPLILIIGGVVAISGVLASFVFSGHHVDGGLVSGQHQKWNHVDQKTCKYVTTLHHLHIFS